MSLDRTHQELVSFHRALVTFNETLHAAERELRDAEARMAEVWDDAFAREFDRRYEPLARPVRNYSEKDAARYADFIRRKTSQIGRYLGHE